MEKTMETTIQGLGFKESGSRVIGLCHYQVKQLTPNPNLNPKSPINSIHPKP